MLFSNSIEYKFGDAHPFINRAARVSLTKFGVYIISFRLFSMSVVSNLIGGFSLTITNRLFSILLAKTFNKYNDLSVAMYVKWILR